MLAEQPQTASTHHVDAASLIAALEDLCQKDRDERRRLVTCKDKVQLFVKGFEAYFDLLSLRTIVRLEWQDCLWQLLELVFQVSLNPPDVAKT